MKLPLQKYFLVLGQLALSLSINKEDFGHGEIVQKANLALETPPAETPLP